MNSMKHIRTEIARVSQLQFAEAAETSQPSIHRWEVGISSPSLDEMKMLVRAYPAIKPKHFFETPPQSARKRK